MRSLLRGVVVGHALAVDAAPEAIGAGGNHEDDPPNEFGPQEIGHEAHRSTAARSLEGG